MNVWNGSQTATKPSATPWNSWWPKPGDRRENLPPGPHRRGERNARRADDGNHEPPRPHPRNPRRAHRRPRAPPRQAGAMKPDPAAQAPAGPQQAPRKPERQTASQPGRPNCETSPAGSASWNAFREYLQRGKPDTPPPTRLPGAQKRALDAILILPMARKAAVIGSAGQPGVELILPLIGLDMLARAAPRLKSPPRRSRRRGWKGRRRHHSGRRTHAGRSGLRTASAFTRKAACGSLSATSTWL